MRLYILLTALFFLVPSPAPASEENLSLQENNGAADTGHLLEVLKHLGYPEGSRAAIEKEVLVLLTRIDFPHLRIEAAQIKSNPLKLEKFITKLGGLIEDNGYIDEHPPHPLVKLLTTSFINDDISQVIFTSPISFWQKVDSKKALVACTAISQLGSIVLDMLEINVKVGFSPAHVFNCIPINDQQIMIVDFSNRIFKIVDINRYYLNLGSRTMKLKDQYHIPPSRILEINSQLPGELRSDPLDELLCFLYHYIYISDNESTTPGIFINLGNIYSRKGNLDEAISYYNKAIALEPEYAEAWRERGITNGNKGNLDGAIADLNKAIELFPEFDDAYHDRASIYSIRNDIDNAISDLNEAIIINPDFVEAYHDRGKAYNSKGETDNAIADYDKAIETDPYFSEAYMSRAKAYYSKQEYDKSWKDVHTVEDFGDEVNADLLEKLKNASMLKNIFIPALIIAPILILLIFRFF